MSINPPGSGDALRLKHFLKISRVSALGAIVIDTALAGQKVGNARDSGENAEKVAYEEYGALIGGIVVASVVTGVVATFLGPGLIILAVAGGISALAGAKLGREIGRRLYEQISAYEASMPPEQKKQLLSDAALSVL